MRLVDYLDKGASLGADAPCLTTQGKGSELWRCAAPELSDRTRTRQFRNFPRGEDRDPIRQRSDRFCLCVWHFARRSRLVSY